MPRISPLLTLVLLSCVLAAAPAGASPPPDITCTYTGVFAYTPFSTGVGSLSVSRSSDAFVETDCLSRTGEPFTSRIRVWIQARNAYNGQWFTIADTTCVHSSVAGRISTGLCTASASTPHSSQYSNTERRAFYDVDAPYDLPPTPIASINP